MGHLASSQVQPLWSTLKESSWCSILKNQNLLLTLLLPYVISMGSSFSSWKREVKSVVKTGTGKNKLWENNILYLWNYILSTKEETYKIIYIKEKWNKSCVSSFFFKLTLFLKSPGNAEALNGISSVCTRVSFMIYTYSKSILTNFTFVLFFLFPQHSKIKWLNGLTWNSLAIFLKDTPLSS